MSYTSGNTVDYRSAVQVQESNWMEDPSPSMLVEHGSLWQTATILEQPSSACAATVGTCFSFFGGADRKGAYAALQHPCSFNDRMSFKMKCNAQSYLFHLPSPFLKTDIGFCQSRWDSRCDTFPRDVGRWSIAQMRRLGTVLHLNSSHWPMMAHEDPGYIAKPVKPAWPQKLF